MEEIDEEFDKTLLWSIEEDTLRNSRNVNQIGTFYLVIASLFIFVVVFFILYFANRKNKQGALDMMKDPNNVFDEFTEEIEEEKEEEKEGEEGEKEVPLIEISEEEQEIPETKEEKAVEAA